MALRTAAARGRFAFLLVRQPGEVQRKMIGVVLLELSVKLSGQFGFLVFVGGQYFQFSNFQVTDFLLQFFLGAGRGVFFFLAGPGLRLLEGNVFLAAGTVRANE